MQFEVSAYRDLGHIPLFLSRRPGQRSSGRSTKRHDWWTGQAARVIERENNSRFDLYRVNLHFNHLQPFGSVAFPFSETRKTALKQPIFVDGFLQLSSDEVRRIGSG
jgi:hypothetical protein